MIIPKTFEASHNGECVIGTSIMLRLANDVNSVSTTLHISIKNIVLLAKITAMVDLNFLVLSKKYRKQSLFSIFGLRAFSTVL